MRCELSFNNRVIQPSPVPSRIGIVRLRLPFPKIADPKRLYPDTTMTVRTRFAPSPTGYLHIGGVRTALFNWLLARQAGGQFILRIDDTDANRNVEAALQPILDGFKWLGMDWDEGPEVGGPHAPYFQSQRIEKHQAAVQQLLQSGHAYRDYSTSQEFGGEREAAEKEKRDFIYSRTWMAETDEQAQTLRPRGGAMSFA